jgi:hypothetical protein
MTHRNRWGRLERAGQLWNQRQADRIVPLLCSMSAKAARTNQAASSKVCSILQQLSDRGVDEDEVGSSWQQLWGLHVLCMLRFLAEGRR